MSTPEPVPAGPASLRFEFEPTGEPPERGKGVPGRNQLYVAGELVAMIEVPYTVPTIFGIIGLSCGRDAVDSVSPADYLAPAHFNGKIHTVTLDTTGEVIEDDDATMTRLMAQQ